MKKASILIFCLLLALTISVGITSAADKKASQTKQIWSAKASHTDYKIGAGDILEIDFPSVKDVSQAFAVATGGPVCNVRGYVVPVAPEDSHDLVPLVQGIDFLDRNEVESRDDFRDVVKRLLQSSSFRLRQIADVPGRQQETVLCVLARDFA